MLAGLRMLSRLLTTKKYAVVGRLHFSFTRNHNYYFRVTTAICEAVYFLLQAPVFILYW